MTPLWVSPRKASRGVLVVLDRRTDSLIVALALFTIMKATMSTNGMIIAIQGRAATADTIEYIAKKNVASNEPAA